MVSYNRSLTFTSPISFYLLFCLGFVLVICNITRRFFARVSALFFQHVVNLDGLAGRASEPTIRHKLLIEIRLFCRVWYSLLLLVHSLIHSTFFEVLTHLGYLAQKPILPRSTHVYIIFLTQLKIIDFPLSLSDKANYVNSFDIHFFMNWASYVYCIIYHNNL